MQRTVDEFADCIRPLSWARGSDLLVEASRPFANPFEGDAARLASKGFLTAVMERLEPEQLNAPTGAAPSPCASTRSAGPWPTARGLLTRMSGRCWRGMGPGRGRALDVRPAPPVAPSGDHRWPESGRR